MLCRELRLLRGKLKANGPRGSFGKRRLRLVGLPSGASCAEDAALGPVPALPGSRLLAARPSAWLSRVGAGQLWKGFPAGVHRCLLWSGGGCVVPVCLFACPGPPQPSARARPGPGVTAGLSTGIAKETKWPPGSHFVPAQPPSCTQAAPWLGPVLTRPRLCPRRLQSLSGAQGAALPRGSPACARHILAAARDSSHTKAESGACS